MSSTTILSYAGWAFLPNVCTYPVSELVSIMLAYVCLKVAPTNAENCSSLQAGFNPFTMASRSASVILSPSQEPPDMSNTDGAYT